VPAAGIPRGRPQQYAVEHQSVRAWEREDGHRSARRQRDHDPRCSWNRSRTSMASSACNNIIRSYWEASVGGGRGMRPSARTPQPKNLRARRSPVHATGVEPSPTRSITVAVTSRREQGEGQRPHKSDTSHHRNNEQNIEPRHLGDSKSINFNWSNLPPPGFNVCPAPAPTAAAPRLHRIVRRRWRHRARVPLRAPNRPKVSTGYPRALPGGRVQASVGGRPHPPRCAATLKDAMRIA
jgi:hypothetical protein